MKDIRRVRKDKKMELRDLPPWEALMKQMVWAQLGEIRNKRILDFGSGLGITADHFAKDNDVIAVEPSAQSIAVRWRNHAYRQICGSTEVLEAFPDGYFDVILCHNVLEYAADRAEITNGFSRIVKNDGFLSLVKHNRPGRVMQMVVLLNDFEQAGSLLDGNDGRTSQSGEIHYYEDTDILTWCRDLTIAKVMGMRTFWDLQQNQEIQRDAVWQEQMIDMELRVSQLEEYRKIAFFHHLILTKRENHHRP